MYEIIFSIKLMTGEVVSVKRLVPSKVENPWQPVSDGANLASVFESLSSELYKKMYGKKLRD